MPTISFDTFTLAALEPPAPNPDGTVKQVQYWDRSNPGFYLRVSSTGMRTWEIKTRVLVNGEWKQRRKKLGHPKTKGNKDGMTLEDARAAARKYRAQCKQGIDPDTVESETRRKIAEASRNTFGVVAGRFLEPNATDKQRRPATIALYRYYLEGGYCAAWKNRPIGSIDRQEINALVRGVKADRKPVAANRLLASIRAMLNWAADEGYITHSPAHDISAPAKESARERHLFGDKEKSTPSEIALAWDAFRKCGFGAPFVQLLLLTGQRRSEVAGMRWDELIDLDGSEPRWFLSGERTKNHCEHIVPLGPLAVAIIKDVPRVENCPFLFSGSGKRPMTGFSKIKRRADDEIAKLIAADPDRYKDQFAKPWTLHDLRRTFDTGLRELGISGDVVDALTNHISGEARRGARKHYNHARYAQAKRAAMLLWERHVTEAGPAKVLQFPASAA